jgi:hypothetical protein
MDDLLTENIGSNEFQVFLEKLAFDNFDTYNLQNFVTLVKALSLYEVKNQSLLQLIYHTLD